MLYGLVEGAPVRRVGSEDGRVRRAQAGARGRVAGDQRMVARAQGSRPFKAAAVLWGLGRSSGVTQVVVMMGCVCWGEFVGRWV